MSESELSDETLQAIVRATKGRFGKADLDHIAADLIRARKQLAEVTKQRDLIIEAFQLVWKHLKGERIRHDYITGTEEAGDLKTLQQVCEEALALAKKKGGEA